MPAYRVHIGGKAQSKIRSLSPLLQSVVLNVMDHELRMTPRPGNSYEGPCQRPRVSLPGTRTEGRLRWRRCATEVSLQILRANLDPGPAVEDACDYVIVYRVPLPLLGLKQSQRFQVFAVVDLVHNTELALRYVLARTPTARPARFIRPP